MSELCLRALDKHNYRHAKIMSERLTIKDFHANTIQHKHKLITFGIFNQPISNYTKYFLSGCIRGLGLGNLCEMPERFYGSYLHSIHLKSIQKMNCQIVRIVSCS